MEKKIWKIVVVTILCILPFIGSTYAYLHATTSTLQNTFVPGIEIDGDLYIYKEIEHPFDDLYEIPEDMVFEFVVDLGDNYAGKNVKTTDGIKTLDSTGCMEIKVKPYTPFIIYEIKVETEVLVTEKLPEDSVFYPKDNIYSQKIKINREDNELHFVNSFKTEESVQIDIEIKKSMQCPSEVELSVEGYTFILLDENNRVVAFSEETDDNGKTKFTLTYGLDDNGKTFHYTLKEENAGETIDGVWYDDKIYPVTVSVIGANDGTIVVEVCEAETIEEYVIEFTNRYVPDIPDTPDNPDVPDVPDKPDEPDAPDVPDIPDKPDIPDEPDIPDDPDDPDNPDTPNDPNTPDKPDDSTGSDQPGTGGTKTGDATNIFLYLTMLFGGGAVILGIYIFVIRKRKEM